MYVKFNWVPAAIVAFCFVSVTSIAEARLSVDEKARLLAGVTPQSVIPGSLMDLWANETIRAPRGGGAHPNLFSPSRRGSLAQFFADNLGIISQETRGVIYFLGGADAIIPNILFPNAERILIVGLEPPGTLPDPERMSVGDLHQKAREIGNAFNYLLTKSYFVTSFMSQDLAQFGTSTMFVTGLVALGARILDFQYVTLDASGNLAPYPGNGIYGVQIKYVKANGQRAEIVYFSQNLDNQNLANRPQFEAFVQNQNFDTAFYKAASFVPHWASMSRANNLVLGKVRNVVQADDGIPLRYFSQNASDWHIRLFGIYTPPDRQFGAVVQEDLKLAFSGVICNEASDSDKALWARIWGGCVRSENPLNFGSIGWGGTIPFRFNYAATTGPNYVSWQEKIRFGTLLVARRGR